MEQGQYEGGIEESKKQALQRIAQTRSEVTGDTWSDGSFDGEAGLGWRGSKLTLKRRAIAVNWHNVGKEIEGAALFKKFATPDTAKLGWLSDSWLAAALSVVATQPRMIPSLFPQHPLSDAS